MHGTFHQRYGGFNDNRDEMTVLCDWKMARDWEGSEGGRKRLEGRKEGRKADLRQSSDHH